MNPICIWKLIIQKSTVKNIIIKLPHSFGTINGFYNSRFKPVRPIIRITILRKDLSSSIIKILRNLSIDLAPLIHLILDQNRQINKTSVIIIKRIKAILSIKWAKTSHGFASFLVQNPYKSNIILLLNICFYIVYTPNRV